jgi:hypothetical protein
MADSVSDELQELLTRHRENQLTHEENERLYDLLSEQIGFGNKIPGLVCSNCGRQMVFIFAWGASVCAYFLGGCGKKMGRPYDRLAPKTTAETR